MNNRTVVLIVAVLMMMTLAGCSLDNPLGATDRQALRSNAYVEAARVQAKAQEAVAVQETVRAGIWASMLIPGLLIVVGGAVAGIVVWWQGKIWHSKTELQGRAVLAQTTPLPELPRPQREHPQLRDLRLLAQQQGYDVEIVDSVAYLVDASGQRVGRRLLTG